MKNRSLPAAGAALILTLAGFGLAGPAAGAQDGGANAAGPYTSCETLLLDTDLYPAGEYRCDPAPVGNGQGKAPHLAGSKGKADDKNPPGQLEELVVDPLTGEVVNKDPNQGYECEGAKNRGVGNGNPAHSGCVLPRLVGVPQ